MEKTLNITPCDLDDVLSVLVAAATPKTDTSGGLATLQDVCRNSQVFRVEQDGQTVAAYAVEVYQYERGECLFVTAGAGQSEGVDLTLTMTKAVEMQARQIGAQQIGLMTRRPALAKKLASAGWEVAGIKLIKKL